MSVGLLIITHQDLGTALLGTAQNVLGKCPVPTAVLEIELSCEPEKQKHLAAEYITNLDQGDGVLILTDMYGSTPSNIACAQLSDKVRAVAGINLPMLIRILNYPHLSLPQLVKKAVSGGKEGVITCRHNNDH